MEGLGLAGHFQRDGKPCTEDGLLEAMEGLHPAIRAFRLHRRYQRLAGEEWLTGCMTGADGRIHPDHHQVGAASGRNTCTTPNIVGIGKVFRPVVTAPPGRAIVELDYSQVEVGVAAAEYQDQVLTDAYNSGDVYAVTAQHFYADRLTREERSLDPATFKARRPDLRDAMKTFVLAVNYNIQAPALAARFGISIKEAERERSRFLDLFPALKRRLEESVVYGATRGYASIISGLRRPVRKLGRPDSWTRNFLRNTPIQGSATVVFKRAVARLDQAFRGTDTWLILPVHDAIVIECPVDLVDEVAERAARIMRDALRAYYPQLQPKVEVNRSHSECWNKDGHADSLDRFLEDPGFRVDGPAVLDSRDSPPSTQMERGAPTNGSGFKHLKHYSRIKKNPAFVVPLFGFSPRSKFCINEEQGLQRSPILTRWKNTSGPGQQFRPGGTQTNHLFRRLNMNLSKSLSAFLSPADIAAPVVISIDRLEEEIVDDLGQEMEMLVLYPKGYDQGIPLRENHLQLLTQILGSKTPANWVGRRIVIFADENVWLYGRKTGGIRFRPAENAT